MPELRTDAQLATAHLAGDRSALAGIYDRFSPGLYDTAAAMLRDRHEAADAMQDVFLIAAERMGQLREAERLKPWLYAILRNEVYRRSKQRGRTLPTDFSAMGAPEMAAPIAPDAEGEALSAAELGELVRSAACGLDERDQMVLELSVRQGLQGAHLAAALGVSAEQSYTLVHRMRDRVERSLGALVVARAGRKDCPDLADVLRGWDGRFTVLVRKRVARHIEHCETCERTRKKAAPLALMSAAPAFAAPASLRDSILAMAGAPGAAPPRAYRFDADGGFPRVLRSVRLPVALIAAATAILVGIGGGAIIANGLDSASASSSSPLPATTVATTVVETTAAPQTTVATTTSSTSSTSTSSTSSSSTTIAPVPGSLTLSAALVDLGAGAGSGGVQVSNPGGLPVAWSVQGNPSPFTLVDAGGTLPAGQTRTMTVTINRTGLGEGTIERTVTLTDGAGNDRQLTMRARVERAPLVVLEGGPSGTLSVCSWQLNDVLVQFSEESGVVGPGMVQWTGPQSGTNQLKPRSDTSSQGSILIPNPTPGAYSYTVSITDLRGNIGQVTGSFTVDPCPN